MSESEEGVPAQSLPLSARAPGKCILFGEHGVVHGAPELVVAIDLEMQVLLRRGPRILLNGESDPEARHPYLRVALARLWTDGPPLEVRSLSRIPRAAGLGASAAFVSALAVGLAAGRGGLGRAALAQSAFDIEREAQGVGSPGDTSASVAGGFVTINGGDGPLLWEVTQGGQRWAVRRARDPAWSWIVAFSGVPRSTATAVRAVTARLARPDGEELLRRFREVANDGIRAVDREDRAATADAMRRNHELLREVGVSHPRLEELLRAVDECADGGKLTGAGAGGSIVVLPRAGREVECLRRLARAGALAYAVRPAPLGAGLVTASARR